MAGKLALTRRSYGDLCWWCGAQADSREHRHKASDVRREFGSGPFTANGGVVRWSGPQLDSVQGPRSSRLTFDRTMCGTCNGARSQPFDRAQEKFNAYVKQHERTIWRTRSVDLRAVYGSAWAGTAENLIRFYVKHVACRLVDHGFEVHRDLVSFLDGTKPLTTVGFQLVIRRDLVQMTKFFTELDGHFPALFLGDFVGYSDGTGPTTRIESSLGYRWLETRWFYDPTTIGSVASLFPAPEIRLGTTSAASALVVRRSLEAQRRPRSRRLLERIGRERS